MLVLARYDLYFDHVSFFASGVENDSEEGVFSGE